MTENKMFQIGKIVGCHGLRGELKIFPLTDFPERFKRKDPILARHPSGRELLLHPLSVRENQGLFLLTVAEFKDLTQAEPWIKSELLIHEENLMPLPKDRYYIHQIIGLAVYLEDGTHLGSVTDVLQPGANDVYVVRLSESGKQISEEPREEILLPVIEDVILVTNLELGRLTVRLLPGL